MATDLTRIGEKARQEPKLVFTSLYHHICDVDNLRACYDSLEARKATGVDGVTKEEYGKNLEENLRDLSARLKRMSYRPRPKRRTSRKKLGQRLREFNDWAEKVRSVLSKGEMIRDARRKVVGHLGYYAITDNARQCTRYVHYATRSLFKWINRKSQRRAYNWDQFTQVLDRLDWPRVSIRKDLNPCRRAEAY